MERTEKKRPLSVEPEEHEAEKKANGPYQVTVPDDGHKYHSIPVEKLPSLGMPYPGVKAIMIREWSTRNAETILEASDNGLRQILIDELRKVTPFPVDLLTYGDVIYILLWQRVNTFGQYFETNLELKGQASRPTVVDLTTVENDTLHPAYPNRKPIEVGGHEVQLDVAREGDTTAQEDFLAMYPNVPKRAVLYGVTIQTIDGLRKSVPEKVQFVNELSARDFKKLEAWHDFFYHHPKEELQVQHPETGEVLRIPYRFRSVEFFIPEGSSLFNIEGEVHPHDGDERGA